MPAMSGKATKVLQSMEKTMKEEVEKFKTVQKGTAPATGGGVLHLDSMCP